jgi:hypothetical protein
MVILMKNDIFYYLKDNKLLALLLCLIVVIGILICIIRSICAETIAKFNEIDEDGVFENYIVIIFF